MKRHWKYSAGLIGSMLFLLTACGEVENTGERDGGEEANGEQPDVETAVETDDEEAPTIGMTVINQEALFFTEMVKGAESQAEEMDVNLTVFNANNDSVEQYNGAEDYISAGVDALVINAIDVEAMKPIVDKAEEEDIPVISIDSVIEHEGVDVQIGVDNYESSVELGEYFNEYAEEQWGDEEVKIGAISALNSPIQINRQDGFMDTILENENVELVNTVDGENVQEKALSASEDLFTANPDMQAAFATGEPAFIGMVSGVRSQQAQDNLKLFGWDLSEQVVEGIDDGYVEAALQQHPDEYGSEAIKAALALVEGEEVEEQIDVPATVVTEDNVDEFRSLFE
ncbi:substrate-binding domain-containing protein [Alteribacillus bidgolensis]|uniref:Monosaccharide ABC transporter substrate-binding protein, CUT2 family n=1 Tax=Alteribacillus bidgolensis TaxID=930129 RepID=A0A1G8E696_9BACI|nr:substrate-binding domain-containing protein [Alteribacillus bidgolensis]SDH65478.1 monosaccharide ABC transporter substrate-binding protein, CUT2 family [Alteribacillus bidgolensis]